MTVYLCLMLALLLIGILCFSNGVTVKSKKIFCNITIVMMLLVQCLRDVSVGEDTPVYILWFKEYCNMQYISSIYHPWRDIDVGYSLLNIILSRLTSNEQILICVVSIIIVTLHIKFIEKNSKSPLISVMLFMGCNFFLTSMVSWRQYIAMGIVFWMYPCLNNKKYIKSLIVLLLAFCFHDTAILFGFAIFVAYFCSRYKYGSLIILSVCIIVVPFLNIIIDKILILLPGYELYFSGTINTTSGIGKLRYVYMIIELMLIMIVIINKNLHSRNNYVLASLMSFSIFSGFLAIYIPYIFRVGYYFEYFILLLIPEIISKSRNRTLIKAIIIACCLVLFIYYLMNNPGETVPYKFCF